MDKQFLAKERLMVPTDFTSPLVPTVGEEEPATSHDKPRINENKPGSPSHFTPGVQSAAPQGRSKLPGIPPPISWGNPGISPALPEDATAASPWLAIGQAQQEILALRHENQNTMTLQDERIRGRIPVNHPSNHSSRCAERSDRWSRWESERRLEAEKHKGELERLKGQVEILRDAAERHNQEMRDKHSKMNRQSHDLEAMREELCKSKTELSQMKAELIHSGAQKEKLSSQLERLKLESAEEIAKLRRDVERNKEEAREIALKAEVDRVQTEEESKRQALRMSEQLQEIQKKQETELQHLNASHQAELNAARKANGELQDRLQSISSEVLQLKSTLSEVSTERDGLREHLSQMGQAFETQSATLHGLRKYIGQLAPENKEREQLNDAVEKLNKEKAALQKTIELLTIRLNSTNEILALQEEKMEKRTVTDPLTKNGSDRLQVLQLWRQEVFKLCVQLRSKDIEQRGEKDQLLSVVRSVEQRLQQEQHRAGVLKHSLDDRIAELDLERVENETVKRDLFQICKENSQLKSQNQNAEAERKTLSEAVQRLCLAFESKVDELSAAQTRLITLTQRLMFANGRMETIQGLIMRKVALQKVQQASKRGEQATDSITNLRTELTLVCEERDKLTQELKRTPGLIDKTLADLREQYESKLQQQQRQLEQSWTQACQAAAGKEEAEQSLRCIQAQLEESKVNVEKLQSELLSQQEHSQQALQQRVSEIEDCCAEKLRVMEAQVNAAKREHSKAVMTLRLFERQAARKRNEMRDCLASERTRGVPNKQPKEAEKDKSLLATAAAETGPARELAIAALQNSAAPQDTPSGWSRTTGAEVQLPAERLLSVLEDLRSLGAAVANSSEDSEEEQIDHTADTC